MPLTAVLNPKMFRVTLYHTPTYSSSHVHLPQTRIRTARIVLYPQCLRGLALVLKIEPLIETILHTQRIVFHVACATEMWDRPTLIALPGWRLTQKELAEGHHNVFACVVPDCWVIDPSQAVVSRSRVKGQELKAHESLFPHRADILKLSNRAF